MGLIALSPVQEVKLKLPNYKSQLLAYNLAKPLTLYQVRSSSEPTTPAE